jgi:hypothetical protein
MLLSIVFIFGIWFRLSIFFLLIELPTILFAVWRETKQTRKYQGDYLVKKNKKNLKNPNVREYFNYNIKSILIGKTVVMLHVL